MEDMRERWKGLHVHNRRAIIAITGLAVLLAIIVVATVTKSASMKDPKTDPLWESLRLPNHTIPIHYKAALTIDLHAKKFSGAQDVSVSVLEKTAVLLIHAKDMNITSTTVTKKDGGSVKIKNSFKWSPNDYWVIKLANYIEPGEYSLGFEWEGYLNKQLEGLYLSSYKENGENKFAVLSQMEPLGARRVLPCFDEPDLKASFGMSIKHSTGLLALWNMDEDKSEDLTESGELGWTRTTYKDSVKMSSYLLAFVIADFKCNDPVLAGAEQIKVRVCGTRAAIEAGHGDYARDMTANITAYYEKFYNKNFPLPKLDSVACPDFSAGAMENWGLILYRETALLYDVEKDTYATKERVNTVVAHELAHQWFGNLVTMKWWNDLWLNEGFASYVEWLGTDHSEPEWNMLEFRSYSDRSRALKIDSFKSSRPVSIPVIKPTDIVSQFDSISYAKGNAIIIQAHMLMGAKKFQQGISDYIQKYQFDNAEQSDLYATLNEAYASEDIDVVEVMNTWTLQMNFPVISVKKYSNSQYVLSQQRFLIADASLEAEKYPSPYGYQWYVPIQYFDRAQTAMLTWLKPNARTTVEYTQSAGNYLLLNKDSAGYYIVDYDIELFDALKAQLMTDHTVFTVAERQGLLFDTFLLIEGGYRPLDLGLDLLSYFYTEGSNNTWTLNEEKLVVLKEIVRQISGISRHIRDDDDLRKAWKAYWLPFATALFNKNGAEYFKAENATDLPEGYQDRLLASQAISIGCSSEVKECTDVAEKMFEDFKADPTSVEAQYKGQVFNAAIANNNTAKDAYDFLWAEYQKDTTSQSEKSTIYYAMGMIQDKDVLLEFSKECLYNRTTIRQGDALYIMGRSIAQTKMGAEVSLDFMIDNWKTIIETFKDSLFAFDSYIAGVLSGFSTEAKLKQITDAFDKAEMGTGRAAYLTAVQKVRANIAWIAKHGNAVKAYINK